MTVIEESKTNETSLVCDHTATSVVAEGKLALGPLYVVTMHCCTVKVLLCNK